jgi:hypothetical protein
LLAVPEVRTVAAAMSDGADDMWTTFCAELARAGAQILRPDAPADPLTRAEGFRYLTRLTRGALESCVEFADPEAPGFYSLSHETLKIGADNPDNLYLNASVDGRLEYLVTGSRGTVHYLGFSTKAGGYGTTGGLAPTGFIDSKSLAVDADGRFSLIVSATKRDGNWLPMTPATSMLIVRQTFLDRGSERRAELAIRRHPLGAPPKPLDPTTLAARLGNATRFVEGTARLFADWARDFARHPNALPPQDQRRYLAAGGDPTIHYYHGYYRLGADEALVVEVPRVPPCESWNLQINNHWMESIDYRYHRAHVNKHTAAYESDGRCTIVIAARDPGHRNWLDTAGHREGTMCFRWIAAEQIVDPKTRVVPLAALGR